MATNRRSSTIYGSSREDVSDGFATKIEEVGAGVTYVGKAETGSSILDAVWRIMKVTELGQDTDIEWADGNDFFDNVWSDRASLIYS